MSDDLTTDELASALRELAKENETQPALRAPGVRRRAVRRGRRRRTALALGAGAATVALTALALTLDPGGAAPAHRQAPAATAPRLPSPSSPAAATPVTGMVDFEKQTLTIDDRVMHITPDFPTPASTGLLTVSAKLGLRQDRVEQPACKVAGPYVVELRGTDRTSIYVGPLACTARTGTWIGLGTKDAVWLYHRLEPGDTLSVVPLMTAAPGGVRPEARATSSERSLRGMGGGSQPALPPGGPA